MLRKPAGTAGRLAGLRSDVFVALFLLGALSLLAERLNRPEGYKQSGRVSIHDGDTLTLNGEKIRLLYIDAPELRQVCRLDRRQYPCGERSRDALIALVGNRQVTCDAAKRDRYRRLLGDCRAGGVDLNRAMIRDGWAVAYDKTLKADEAEARRRGAGRWAGTVANPTEWRRRRGAVAEIEFGLLAEWGIRLGEALGLVRTADWQNQGEAPLE